MSTMTTTEKPDYEIARDEIASKWKELGLRATIQGGDIQTDKDNWQHRAYRVAIRYDCPGPADVALLPWRAGLGIQGEPNPAEVLATCCRDYLDARGRTF